MAKLYSADRDERRRASEAVTVALEPGLRTRTFVFNTIAVDKSIDDRLRGYETWISARNLSNDTTDEAVQALIDAVVNRYDVVQRYYTLKARLLGLDRLVVLRPHGAARGRPDAGRLGGGVGARAERVRGLLDRDRRHRRALLPRELDRRSAARRQAAGRVLRDERARRPPVRLHELHGRPPLRAHARPRARPRPPRLPRRAARAVQRLDAAHDRRDGVGVRRGAHVQAAARRRGGSAPPAQPARRVGSRTRSRRSSARSR